MKYNVNRLKFNNSIDDDDDGDDDNKLWCQTPHNYNSPLFARGRYLTVIPRIYWPSDVEFCPRSICVIPKLLLI